MPRGRGAGVKGRAYEAERVHEQSCNGVCQVSQTEDVEVPAGNNEIPDEVASGQRLDQTSSPSIAPDTLLRIHVLALVVDDHDPYGKAIDQGALDQGDNMDIPTQLLASGELRVVPRRGPVGDERRDGIEYSRVEEGGCQHLMDVQRKRREAEKVGQGLGRFGQPRDWCEKERVLHDRGTDAVRRRVG